jgi:hypothetical protein
MTFGSKTFARVSGEPFDGDQLEGVCNGCDLPHSRCACDPEHEPTWEEFVGPFKRLAKGWNRVEF